MTFDYIDNSMDNEYIDYENNYVDVEELESPILKPDADLRFTNLYDKTLPVKTVNLNNGVIESIELTRPIDGKEVYNKGEFFLIKETLDITGVGKVAPGSLVRYKGSTYLLLFGWHTNYSNQNIYSWYLSNDKECHTVYKEMIDKIDLVKIIKF